MVCVNVNYNKFFKQTFLLVLCTLLVTSESIYQSLESLGRNMIPRLVRMNTRNALKMVKFMKNLKIRIGPHASIHVEGNSLDPELVGHGVLHPQYHEQQYHQNGHFDHHSFHSLGTFSNQL